jgi:hypothetical protein
VSVIWMFIVPPSLVMVCRALSSRATDDGFMDRSALSASLL